MAGLVAAARLRELGAAVVVREKGTRVGGSMLLSSCVIWRHRELEAFRDECPQGDEALQRLVWERLDDAMAWLVARGAPVVWDETGNPRTVGKRFDPRGLVDALAGEIALGADGRVDGPLILCTGGFAASAELVTRFIRPAAPLRLRANPWSVGDGLEAGLERGARSRAAWTSSTAATCPTPRGTRRSSCRYRSSTDGSRGSSTRTASSSSRAARCRGRRRMWSRRRPAAGCARRTTSSMTRRFAERVRDRTVADMVEAAPAESRVALADLPFDPRKARSRLCE